jgi:hypothetical protein
MMTMRDILDTLSDLERAPCPTCSRACGFTWNGARDKACAYACNACDAETAPCDDDA